MNLFDVAQRVSPAQPWVEGDNIPWNEPDFSQRMLKEHLSQQHDAASRRFEIIDRHVTWIHQEVVADRAVRVLDLGCGPGLYTSRLAHLGHTCAGIDFSPAAIAYARQQAAEQHLNCTYREGDLRQVDFDQDFDLVMQIFGEFNVFKPDDIRLILQKSWQALKPGGTLLLEVHSLHLIQQIGTDAPRWSASSAGLFSEKPHIYLEEGFWDETALVATRRHFVIDAASAEVTRYAASYQGYHDHQYLALLAECGFSQAHLLNSLAATPNQPRGDLLALLARK